MSLNSRQTPPHTLSFEEGSAVKCDRCGLTAHNQTSECSARNMDCYIGGKKGHFARVCRSKPKAFLRARPALHKERAKCLNTRHQLEEENDEDTYSLLHKWSNQAKSKPLVVRLEVQVKEIQMQIDTGSLVSDL